MNCACVGVQLLRYVQPGVPGGDEHMAEGSVPIQLEPSLDGADTGDARAPQAPVPAAALAQPLDVREELGDARVIAVEQRSHERRRRSARDRRPEGEAGERRGSAVAVAL